VISEECREALRSLSSTYTVCLVSGRSNDKLRHFLQLDGLYLAGSHGVHIVGPHGTPIEGLDPTDMVGEQALSALFSARQALDATLGDLQGYLTEDNKFCISAHYRMVDESLHARVRGAVDSVLAQHPCLALKEGKMVYELRPAIAWNKGVAVEFILRKLNSLRGDGAAPLFPVYIGDDVADEDAFRVVAACSGVGIKVADGPVMSDKTFATLVVPQPNVVSLLSSFLPAAR
jgi:trehalose 6-phosphate phosphatase